MNKLRNNLTKQCISLFLIYSIVSTTSLQSMELNNKITVENKTNHPTSLLQVQYYKNSKKYGSVGRNFLFSAPGTISFFASKDEDGSSLFRIWDPRSKSKNEVDLKINDNTVITIEPETDKTIIAKINETIFARFIYQ